MINIETWLKEESLKNWHMPTCGLGTELFWLRTRDLIEINWTIEAEAETWWLSKSSFNIALDNTTAEYSDLWYWWAWWMWNPQNNTSINKYMYFSAWYKNTWSQQSVFIQKWQIRDFQYNSGWKQANLWLVDSTVNLYKEITNNTTYENITPGQAIWRILEINWYNISNNQWEKKAYFHYLDTLYNDEAEFLINSCNFYWKNSLQEIEKLIQIWFWKIWIDRYWDIHYATILYLLNKNIWVADFEVSDNNLSWQYPLFDFDISLNYSNIYNVLNTKIYDYTKLENWYNFLNATIKVWIWETVSQVLKLDWLLKWAFTYTTFCSEFETGWGIDYTSDCIFNIIDNKSNLQVNITNNSWKYLYIVIQFVSDFFYKLNTDLIIYKKDETSITNFWENRLDIDNEYIQNYNQWQAILSKFLELYKEPKRYVEIETVWLIDLELYDKILIQNSTEIKNTTLSWLCNRIKYKYSQTNWFSYIIWLDLLINLNYSYFLEKFVNTLYFDTNNSEFVSINWWKLQLESYVIEPDEVIFTDVDLYEDTSKTGLVYQLSIENWELILDTYGWESKEYTDIDLYNDEAKTWLLYQTLVNNWEISLTQIYIEPLQEYTDIDLYNDEAKTWLLYQTLVNNWEISLTQIYIEPLQEYTDIDLYDNEAKTWLLYQTLVNNWEVILTTI